MLIRFVINNILSFGTEKEFNMLPLPSITRLSEHKYQLNNHEVLKMAAIYGANGAGKSNLIQALIMLEHIVRKEEIPSSFYKAEFRFNKDLGKKPLTFVIEFFQDNQTFLYGLEILDNTVVTEELYQTDIKDELLFQRKTDINTKKTTLTSPLFENNDHSIILKEVIEQNLSKPNKIIFRQLTTLNAPYLEKIAIALKWFDEVVEIVTPKSKPYILAHKLDINTTLKQYADQTMMAFNVGIESLSCHKSKLEDFYAGNQEKINDISEKLAQSPTKLVSQRNKSGEEIIFAQENAENYVLQIKIEHKGQDDKIALFDLNEESDGTIRLLDLVPAFYNVVQIGKVFVIDEIERSIHPLLIKELVQKFSQDDQTNGQLIFTTHESNLLDQAILRADEIWFVEKDDTGSSDLYPLSNYKELNIDIRKGYLDGRYGSIPFLANLKDLNWHKYAVKE